MRNPPSRHPSRPGLLSPATVRVALAAVAVALVSGCDGTQAWDTEFHCVGQEESMATFLDGAPAPVMRKAYPHNIDFHLRSGTAMVRSALVKVDDTSAAVMHFEARGSHVWISGQFDQPRQQLQLIEERTLTLEGRQQLVRTTGQYRCTDTRHKETTA